MGFALQKLQTGDGCADDIEAGIHADTPFPADS